MQSPAITRSPGTQPESGDDEKMMLHFRSQRFLRKVGFYFCFLLALDEIHFMARLSPDLSSRMMQNSRQEQEIAMTLSTSFDCVDTSSCRWPSTSIGPALSNISATEHFANDAAVIIYCDVSKYLQATSHAAASPENINNFTAQSVIQTHLEKVLYSLQTVFVKLSPSVTSPVVVLLDGAEEDRTIVDQIKQQLRLFFKSLAPKKVVGDNLAVTSALDNIQINNLQVSSVSHNHSLGLMESLRRIINDIQTTYVYVIHSNQPFLDPPYRYATTHAFNQRKWKVPLSDSGGGDIRSEPSRSIRINHTALCRAVQSHPKQLASQPIRFVSDSYASKHFWDGGALFNNCHLNETYSHHPVHLIVNDDTRSIVDDPDRYYAYLTDVEMQQQRLAEEANHTASFTLHFFKSYEEEPSLLETENHFATTEYYQKRFLSLNSRAEGSIQTVDSCQDGHYVYGRPFTRISHFLYAYVYTGEIYVETLDRATFKV
jgi:hypothetical protein